MHTNTLLSINRQPLEEYDIVGYLVGLSERLLLLHIVDKNTLRFNGYAAVRLADIHGVSPGEHFAARALPLLGRVPVPPPVPFVLDNMGEFLASVQQHYPLVAFEAEAKKPGAIFIGRIVKQTTRQIVLHTTNSEGYWDDEETFAVSDITRATAGDEYITALAALIAHEGSNKSPS